jgi:hypothetical protein
VVFTIHQPRSNIVAMFDKLVLLAKGKMVYSGDYVGCQEYFGGVGMRCPEGYNLADYLSEFFFFVFCSFFVRLGVCGFWGWERGSVVVLGLLLLVGQWRWAGEEDEEQEGAGDAGVDSCVGDATVGVGAGDGVEAGFHINGVLGLVLVYVLVLVLLLMLLLMLRPVMLVLVFVGGRGDHGAHPDVGVGKVVFLSSPL